MSIIKPKQFLILLLILFLNFIPVFAQDYTLENKRVHEIDSLLLNPDKKLVKSQILGLINKYRVSGDYISTIVAINKLKPVLNEKDEKERRLIAGLNVYLGQAYNGLGLYSETLNTVSPTLIYVKKNDEKRLTLLSLMILSEAYMGLKIKDKGKAMMLEAYGIADTIGEMKLKKIVLGNLSNIYFELNKLDSLNVLLNKLESLEENKNKPVSFVHLHKANYYLKKNMPDSALYFSKLFEKELSYFKNAHNKMASHQVFSEIYLKKGQYDLAEEYAKKALEIAQKEKYKNALIDIYSLLSEISEKDKPAEAKIFREKKEALKDSITTSNMRSAVQVIKLLYDIEKKSMDIERLNLENSLKETKLNTLYLFLLTTIFIIGLILFQKKKLKIAYDKLVKESIESLKVHEEMKNLRKQAYHDENQDDIAEEEKEDGVNEDSRVKITPESMEQMELAIHKLFDEDKIYLDKELDLDKLAGYLNTNRVYLSHVFNKKIKLSFNEMLNKYRINEAKKLLLLNAEKYTIEAVAMESGYKNRVTFTRNFKRITGVTPTYFINSTKSQKS